MKDSVALSPEILLSLALCSLILVCSSCVSVGEQA